MEGGNNITPPHRYPRNKECVNGRGFAITSDIVDFEEFTEGRVIYDARVGSWCELDSCYGELFVSLVRWCCSRSFGKV